MDQNIDSFGFDQIQPSQYPKMGNEVFQAKGNIMKSIQTFLEKFNRISFGEMPKVLLQAWEKYFAIQHAQPEDTNELFQKLLEDLHIINEEPAEYINSPSWNCPTFYNNDEEHFVQYKEYLENSSKAIAAMNFNQEKENTPQNSDIRQLVREECGIKVCEKQKQNMEDTLLYALNSKLLLINLRSQRLNKKKKEVKNIVDQPTKHGTQPEYSLSIGNKHLSTIPETESDEVIKSSAKSLVPIPSEYEVTYDDESNDDESISSDEDVLIEDFKVYLNPLFDDEEINSDKINPHCFNAESDLIESLSNHDTLIGSSSKIDYLKKISGELMPLSIINEERIRREHEEYISLMEKLLAINSFPRPLENFHANMIVETLPSSTILVEDSDSLWEEIDIFTELLVNDSISLPKNESSNFDHHDDPSFPRPPPEPPNVESFFDFEPDSRELISDVKSNIDELNEDERFDP
uniref:Reverse transcriptase domain-containing protein n=1 Tax=Tanacetum cinerariifolium TaxID=118510 RepID=A0A6L2LTS6_TANCI|nr:hypothetical protein [Tanacetum cinerariifolium]